MASFADRIRAADAELRRTLGAFAADAEAQRAALAERLAELSRRVDEIVGHAGAPSPSGPYSGRFPAPWSCANNQGRRDRQTHNEHARTMAEIPSSSTGTARGPKWSPGACTC